MIKENRIMFGQGTVLVGASTLPAAISFRSSITARAVGMLVKSGSEQIDKTVSFALNIERYAELSQKLLQVENREVDVFSFCGYLFDFSNYNLESVRVIRDHARATMTNYLVARVC